MKITFYFRFTVIILFFCCFANQELQAQSPLADSLKNELLLTQDDSLFNEILMEIINEGFDKNLDTASRYLHVLASKIDTASNGKYTQLYFKNISIIERQNGNGKKALLQVQKAIDFNKKKTYGLSNLLFAREKLTALSAIQDFEELISEGINMLTDSPDSLSRNIADIHRTVASAYRKIKKFGLSTEYHNKAKEIYEKLDEKASVGGQYLNLASIYGSQKEYDKCISHFKKAIQVAQEIPHSYLLSMASQNLSQAYVKTGKLDSASFYLDIAKEAAIDLNIPMLDVKIDQRKSNILIEQKKYKEALIILRDLNERTKDGEEYFFRSSILKNLAKCLEETGSYDEANTHLRTALILKDTIFQKDMANAVSDATEKYESEKKEAQIRQLAVEDELNQTQISRQRLALGGTVGALGFLAFFFYRLFNQKKIIDQQNQEKETLLKEIHHRVKNNLQVISSLLGMQSRTIKDKVAQDALNEGRARVHSMSLIHQDLYRKDNLSGIDVTTYIPKLAKNLIDTYNIGNTVELITDIDNIILDVESMIPIGLIINELVTNVLKYAFPENRQGTIEINFNEESETLSLSVKDDGIGLNEHQLQQKEESFGHKLIAAFKQKLDAEIDIDGTSGTNITIYIKNYKKIN